MNTKSRETLTVEEAAQILGIGRNQAYVAVRNGTIPSLRFGKRYVIPRRMIDSLLGPGANDNIDMLSTAGETKLVAGKLP